MPRILTLWAVPRSRSTAFEQMMRARGDHVCLHAPFGEAWYLGADRRCPPQRSGGPTPGLTFASVWDDLQSRAAGSEPVFIKEFPHYVEHLCDDAFLDHFIHSFLIRDPARTLPSMYDKWPDFALAETGFLEHRTLFDLLADRQGKAPPVIDAEDLVADPGAVVAAWCDAVGIEFLPDALAWTAPEDRAHSWYDNGSWHDNLRTSTGLEVPPTDYLPIEAEQRMVAAHEACLPHYEALAAHRIAL